MKRATPAARARRTAASSHWVGSTATTAGSPPHAVGPPSRVNAETSRCQRWTRPGIATGGRRGRLVGMCGRYVSTRHPDDLVKQIRVTEWNPEALVAPNWNVAPTNQVPVIMEGVDRDTGALERHLRPLRWGLVPSWAKDPAIGSKMINARMETVHEKPTYRRAFSRRRCTPGPTGLLGHVSPGNAGADPEPYAVD
ncbi:SOS response-associated peptidase [Actinacidiphila glaucinigra]